MFKSYILVLDSVLKSLQEAHEIPKTRLNETEIYH
jgi:hypothetical protein